LICAVLEEVILIGEKRQLAKLVYFEMWVKLIVNLLRMKCGVARETDR
jgi:hypothetical protein